MAIVVVSCFQRERDRERERWLDMGKSGGYGVFYFSFFLMCNRKKNEKRNCIRVC